MDNHNKNRQGKINMSDIDGNDKSRDGEGFDFLKGLSDQELDDLLDCVIDDGQGNEEDNRTIDAILDELKRRCPNDFVMSETKLQKALERFYERAKSAGIIIDNKGKSDR